LPAQRGDTYGRAASPRPRATYPTLSGHQHRLRQPTRSRRVARYRPLRCFTPGAYAYPTMRGNNKRQDVHIMLDRLGRPKPSSAMSRPADLPYTGSPTGRQPAPGHRSGSSADLVSRLSEPLPPTQPAPRRTVSLEKSRRRRAYPQQIVTTRLLYCLQDPFAQLSRLQRI
jgi:hypothetical protein